MTDFYMKQHDVRPALVALLKETPAGGEAEAINLEAAEAVYLVVREKGAADTEEPKFKKECEITTAAEGKVTYVWEEEDTDTAGEFYFEFEIEWSANETETVPRKEYNVLDVEADLDKE